MGEPPSRVGPFVITGVLGRGGMGVVYSARDERLGRDVALKMMSGLAGGEASRERFLREARLAASVSHPNVCPLYEIGEHEGEPFLAMELLRGESLAQRLARGPLSPRELLPVAQGILSALAALHERGVIHRDLKPSNIFLTPHGVKLLDFGLARGVASGADPASSPDLTRTGVLMGTPRYMSPEQVTGEPVTARSDLFAAGAVCFEALAGRAAFPGENVIEVLHATLHEQPPALTGSPAVAAIDRVLRRALAKRPADRPASALAMAEELAGVSIAPGEVTPTLARTLTRMVVLPFRVLRPDPDTDFLAVSLPDAISTSLARSSSLVVRSSAAAARFSGDAPDFKTIAGEADVDRVVTGTLLRSGDELQATVQLVEAPSGTLVTSHSVRSSLGDLFRLQDDICRTMVDALALPLGEGPATPAPGARVDPRAYEHYLRGNALGRRYDRLLEAREHYQRALEIDPGFAEAWAQLGRSHRVIGKFIDDSEDSILQAEEAFRRAQALQPRLPLLHKLYAQLEADTGQSIAALRRLLGEAVRKGNDAELFAGLVHACRYCGLYEQALAAHAEARRLDPHIPTSLAQTLQVACEFDRLFALDRAEGVLNGDEVILVIALAMAGRRADAGIELGRLDRQGPILAFRVWIEYLEAWFRRDPEAMRRHRARIVGVTIMDDPEAIYQEGWIFCEAGDFDHGFPRLRRAVQKGYFASENLRRSHAFDPIRERAEFIALLAESDAGRQRALDVFREEGGPGLLGR